MLRSFLPLLLVCGALLSLDVYVYRNWRRFARPRPRLRWTLPVYQVLMPVVPALLAAYATTSRWWTVEPKALRAAFIGFLLVYYLPKLLVAGVLLLKDAARFVGWLFEWFRARLHPAGPMEAPSPSEALDLADMPNMTRAEFLRRMGWTAASVPFVVVGYGVFRTLYDFTVHRVDVPIAGLPRALEGLTIAQLSDLHAGSFFSERPMWRAVEHVNALRPDLVAITGDFVNHDAGELELIAPALRALRADLGVYGCLGNHDHYARVGDVVAGIRDTPVDLLVNEHRSLAVDGARLHILGTDNTGFRQDYADLPAARRGLDPADDDTLLLLAHDPTFWDQRVRPDHPDVDLMLCGHTHGGQLGVELGPLRWSLARVAYPRWAGLYAEPRSGGRGGHQHLYVNRGLGTVGPPIRLGIRPEITLLTLRRA